MKDYSSSTLDKKWGGGGQVPELGLPVTWTVDVRHVGLVLLHTGRSLNMALPSALLSLAGQHFTLRAGSVQSVSL